MRIAMVVYVDVVFITNFVIDTMTLTMTAWVQKVKIKFWRVMIASILGALYVVMMFFPMLSSMYTLLIKFIFSAGMIFIAFGFHSLQHFFRNIVAFYIVNFVTAGGIIGVYYVTLSQQEYFQGILFSSFGTKSHPFHLGLAIIIVLALGVLGLYRYYVRVIDRRQALHQFIAEIEIEIEKHRFHCKGLIDTGNRLYDPLTLAPVMVLECSVLKDILSEGIIQCIAKGDQELFSSIDEEQFLYRDRLRFVPYRGIQQGTQFLLALKPEKVTIFYNEQRIEQRKVLLGLRNDSLSSEGKYQAIIHPELIERVPSATA